MYKIPAKTLFLGKNLIFVPECHSTNSLALQLDSSKVGEGTVVITNCQTAGRGQRGNSWEAEPGKNLTFSIILKPAFLSLKDQFFLNIFCSLGIYDFLTGKTNATIAIKWPNDILANGKKICGILIENHIYGSQVSNAVVGIGFNVNQTHFAIDSATALHTILDGEQDLEAILEDILVHLEARYLQLRQGDLTALKEDYLSAMHWRNEKHVFRVQERLIDGIIRGIDAIGKLTIETEGSLMSFDIKEISYVQ